MPAKKDKPAPVADSDRMTAEAEYKALSSERQPYLERAYQCAKLTIPTLIASNTDQSKKNESHTIEQPWQSIGSTGVNTLSAKFLLTILPPNSSMAMLSMGKKQREELTGLPENEQPEAKAKIDAGLQRVEQEILRDMETTPLRTALFGVLKHLLVAGNILLHVDKKPKALPLNRYVVKRDPQGVWTKLIVREIADKKTLPEGFMAMVKPQSKAAASKKYGSDNIELYTVVELQDGGKTYKSWQECFKLEVTGTAGTFDADAVPWLPLRMIAVDGEDYGRGYVEELFGDLQSAEHLTQSIVQGAQIAARLLWMVNPNGLTDEDDIQDAANGDTVPGREEDVKALKADKGSDFVVASNTLDKVIARLERAFLMNSSVQRNGERVTAYEIQTLTQELDETLGGYYSIFSQEMQLPIYRRWMANMARAGELPKFPKGSVEPTITTGISALGRGQDLSKLRAFIGDFEMLAKAKPSIADKLNDDEMIQRLANGHGIDTMGLIKSDDEVAQERAQVQQAQMGQEVISKAAGPVAQAAAKAATGNQ